MPIAVQRLFHLYLMQLETSVPFSVTFAYMRQEFDCGLEVNRAMVAPPALGVEAALGDGAG